MELDARVAKNVAHITGASERMRALLNDLLDFNRVSFGLGLLINRAHVDLAQACAEEVELLKVNWPNHQIKCQSSGPTEGLFDESRVREVVWNLVTNAAKYGDADQPINVHVEGVNDRVRLRVVNGGAAIPEAQVEELFEPLRRASNKDAVDGSLGLGLFVVKQVALAHGGNVEVHCTDGLTEFSVVLARGN
jgi:signal transduction histidine kinase